MKVAVDKNTCIGCGLCAQIAPDVFEMTQENIAIVKSGDIPEEKRAACTEAATSCPVEAISISG